MSRMRSWALCAVSLACASCDTAPLGPSRGDPLHTPAVAAQGGSAGDGAGLGTRPEHAAGGQKEQVVAPGQEALGDLATFHELPLEPELVNATIGPEGGTVALGDFELVVPAGAVSRNTLFMIRRPVDRASRQHVFAEFMPHNVTFAVPVTVRLPLAGTTAEGEGDSAVVYWDGEGWVETSSAVIEDGARIEVQTTHLSFWGVRRVAEISSGG